jgi:hypothetical protein
VVFYTADCPWSRMSVRNWNRLREELADTDAVAAVSLSDSAASFAYPRETGLRFPISVARDRNGVMSRWHLSAVPYTVLFDGRGRVQGAWTGVVDSLRYQHIRESIRRIRVNPD